MIALSKDNFEEQVARYDGLCVIDLYADWCAPCKMLAPTLYELEKEYTEVRFCKINVDEQMELASQFGVRSIPMVAFVKDDTFLDFTVGLVPKEDIIKKIEENML